MAQPQRVVKRTRFLATLGSYRRDAGRLFEKRDDEPRWRVESLQRTTWRHCADNGRPPSPRATRFVGHSNDGGCRGTRKKRGKRTFRSITDCRPTRNCKQHTSRSKNSAMPLMAFHMACRPSLCRLWRTRGLVVSLSTDLRRWARYVYHPATSCSGIFCHATRGARELMRDESSRYRRSSGCISWRCALIGLLTVAVVFAQWTISIRTRSGTRSHALLCQCAWDFAECVPITEASGGYPGAIRTCCAICRLTHCNSAVQMSCRLHRS